MDHPAPESEEPVTGSTKGLKLRHLVEAVALIPVLLVLSLLPLIRPATARPAPTDAVVVLSGDHGERLPVAMSLVEKGLTRTLVFVGTPDRVEEDQLCQSPGDVEYICLRPKPDNTRAEARAVARLAKSRRWTNVVVVTSRFHVTRSRLVFRRCLDAEVRMMGGDPPYGREVLVRQIRLEWAKVIYTVVSGPDC
ncbi:MAG: hypothetical protein AVDCRST_MAG76-1023 [uncultured Acidimicrobiales bacterium]|uniref:DUF218 domain-containing protein n=1 Tax=uncultured Acidimicrobiales bacterium TaxID=310071 RepID=A0A6J4HK30_9ACTN|nr:MAG: hypothetical protein AVDCRST_MAG76-1023 [uncultured Acidimicrobiales bacterium]